ncbi:hypothetical protein [Microbacterium sp.]|uniref:hypothetical protein n=1 Tax=Microbacterium sp. TaxID=51671 RepID=UPI0037CB1474
MSTEPTRRRRRDARRRRAYLGTFAGVLGVLAVLGLAGAAASAVQGPRVTDVQVDPAAAVATSGSRLIITTNQALREIDPAQVEVTPDAPFTVDTSGRNIGLRFALPLHDETDYTVTVREVTGVGGGPAATITRTFTTPPVTAYLLQRTDRMDTIFRTDLGGSAHTIFEADHIEDYRATSAHLVISTLDDAGHARLIVTDLDGQNPRDLALPGEGLVMSLQAADRGELIGYTFSDADLGSGGTLESALYIASARDADADAAPTAVTVPGDEQRIADWRFVPDTDSILMLPYDGRLLLSAADGSGAVDLGTGIQIDGIARGSSVAVVQTPDGLVEVDLTDGTSQPLVDAAVDGLQGVVTPIPTAGTGLGADTVRQHLVLDGDDAGTHVHRVSGDGTPTRLFTAPAGDAVLQTCVSPSGRYVAITVAPDLVGNPYDAYLMPIPRSVETHIVDLADGTALPALAGFDLSWCLTPPPLSQ